MKSDNRLGAKAKTEFKSKSNRLLLSSEDKRAMFTSLAKCVSDLEEEENKAEDIANFLAKNLSEHREREMLAMNDELVLYQFLMLISSLLLVKDLPSPLPLLWLGFFVVVLGLFVTAAIMPSIRRMWIYTESCRMIIFALLGSAIVLKLYSPYILS